VGGQIAQVHAVGAHHQRRGNVAREWNGRAPGLVGEESEGAKAAASDKSADNDSEKSEDSEKREKEHSESG